MKLVDGTLNGTAPIVVDIGAKANALRVVPANDITDGTYIGDIRFAEALPANTNTQEIVGDAAENAVVAGNPVLVGGRYDSSPRTLGNTDVGAIALDADGAVHIADGGNTITIDGSLTTVSTVTNLAQMGGVAISLNEGTFDTGTQRVTIATNDDLVAYLATIAGDTTSIDGNITACNTGAVVISSGTITTVSTVTAVTSLDKAVYVDDADWVDNTSSHTLVGGIYQVSPHTVTDGDVSPFQLDVNGRLIESNSAAIATSLAIIDDWDDTDKCKVIIQTGSNVIGTLAANSGIDIGDVTVNNASGASAVNIQDGGNTITVDGTITADAGTNLNTSALALESDGNLATIAGDTTAIQAAVEIMDDWDATQGSVVSSDGIQLMGAYDSTKPSAVSDGQSARVLVDSYGRLLPGVEPEWFNAVFDSANATAEGQVVKAATASKKIYIMSYIISSDIEGWIKLQDEDSNALTGKFWLKAGGGVSWTAPPNAPLILDVVNKALEVIAEAVGDVSVSVTGYLAV